MTSFSGSTGCLAVGLAFLAFPVVIDIALVQIGKRHAQRLCEDPGPLAIYDRKVWDTYSQEVRRRLPPRWDNMHDTPMAAVRIRQKLILSVDEVKIRNPLFATVSQTRWNLKKNSKAVASLTYYRSHNSGVIIRNFFGIESGDNGFKCSSLKNYLIPEFF